MEPTMTLPDTPPDLELRVLDGAQVGARAPLPVGVGCVLAAEPDGAGADIVLREDPGAPARVRVTADVPHALLEVLHGQVELGEQLLAAGAEVAWHMHAPLRIGPSLVAFGPVSDDEWPRAAAPMAAASEASAGESTPTVTSARPRGRAEVWLATLGAGIALASAGALVLAHVMAAPSGVPGVDAAPLAVALRTSEFAALDPARDADGRVELHGRLATLAQRMRLDAWLAERQFTPRVNVQVDEAIARDVTDVFRVNGVAVQARTAGAGRIIAEASERDPDRLARAEEVVRRDVRGLEKLTVINTAIPAPPPAPPVADDPGKRIASLVPGDPAYLVTADGARYFVGALLPTGHRITQIAQQRVTLERDGQSSTLNF